MSPALCQWVDRIRLARPPPIAIYILDERNFFFCKFGQICWDCICLSMRGNLGRGWFWVEEEEDAKFCWSIYHSNSNNTQLFLLSRIWKRRKAFMNFGISQFKSNQLCVKTCLASPTPKYEKGKSCTQALSESLPIFLLNPLFSLTVEARHGSKSQRRKSYGNSGKQ